MACPGSESHPTHMPLRAAGAADDMDEGSPPAAIRIIRGGGSVGLLRRSWPSGRVVIAAHHVQPTGR